MTDSAIPAKGQLYRQLKALDQIAEFFGPKSGNTRSFFLTEVCKTSAANSSASTKFQRMFRCWVVRMTGDVQYLGRPSLGR